MTTGNQYNDKFKSHLGEGGAKAHKYCHMSGGPWCCAEVSLVYGETNKSLFYGGKYCTYCPNAIKWCRAYLAEIPMYLAMGGDPIFFDWNGNGVPDHIGEVDHRINTDQIATVEGNTGSPALVRKKTRPRKYVIGVFRPLFKPATTPEKEPLKIDGAFEYKSVYMFQIALGLNPTGVLDKATVKKWQKTVGTTPDGSWQKKTTLAAQAFLKVKKDGAWGIESTKALQKWINNKVFPSKSTSTPTTNKTTASTTKPTPTKPTTSTPTRTKMKAIGHARKDYDHKAGDSSGKEVLRSKFIYKASSGSVYNWTYVFRPKSIDKANKAATMCERGIANNNIGYCSKGETAYGEDRAMTKLAKAVKYDLSKITTKCGCSCGDLICLCNHWAGLSTCYIGNAKPLAENLKKNSNFTCYKYKKGMQLYRGDVLITAHSNGKHNHVVMCL